MHVELVEMLQQRSEPRAIGHLGEGIVLFTISISHSFANSLLACYLSFCSAFIASISHKACLFSVSIVYPLLRKYIVIRWAMSFNLVIIIL
ncbi:MAG: hypothetical protein IJK78_00510 [Bacteroidales bacterium]|nr:hypothetical protein [Bacteroidales bacterium]